MIRTVRDRDRQRFFIESFDIATDDTV